MQFPVKEPELYWRIVESAKNVFRRSRPASHFFKRRQWWLRTFHQAADTSKAAASWQDHDMHEGKDV